ncbi:MAG: NAD(P)H-dependent oxidoreductase [Desulfuromonadales bacterium]|jgi:chromate reductase, NAD(P)H dehydrogenase (quinone)
MKAMNILGICGSLRKQSTNLGLLNYARENAPEGMGVKIADLSEVPFYNADLKSVPSPVQALLDDLERADALLLACPEYNYSMAPALKNALDWASRAPKNKLLDGKPAAILGSGGGMGSARAQYHLRQVCVFLNIHLLNKPEVFSNAFNGSFDEKGCLTDERIQGLVEEQLIALMAWTQKVRS